MKKAEFVRRFEEATGKRFVSLNCRAISFGGGMVRSTLVCAEYGCGLVHSIYHWKGMFQRGFTRLNLRAAIEAVRTE
jgi:hypothetical protein